MTRRCAAEFGGAWLLTATVVGSGIMGANLADGNDAVALLGNTLATAAILVVLIAALGPVSGAHFNPAVSLVFLVRRELAPSAFAAYVAVQIAGCIAGAWTAHLMFELPILQTSGHVREGLGQFLAEAVATFGLVGTILGCRRARPDLVPVAVALFIAAGYWFTASTSFANPAITIARSLTDTFAGIRPADAPWFIAAQIVGALLAAAALHWLLAPAPKATPAASDTSPLDTLKTKV